MPVRNIQILIFVVMVCLACNMQAERLKYGGKLGRNLQLIQDNYVDEVDPDDLYVAAMQGIVSKLDQFSDFIPPDRYREFQSVIEQEFGGVGVLIEGPPAVEQLTVISPIPGTPAYKAGMRPGDVIVSIDGESTVGLTAVDATKRMRGPVGEAVKVNVKRDGTAEALDMEIVRADIQVDSVYGDRVRGDSTPEFFLENDPDIAYIRITLFGEKTVSEFAKAIDEVKDRAKGIILDLRYNPGGILDAAVLMCDMLIDEGMIVSTKGRVPGAGREWLATNQIKLPQDIPMIVLVNDQSASASEIMAGCLQDAGRALIGGQRSFGKGTVQQVFPLDGDTTALKFTTARFYRPSGANIHRTEEMKDTDQWGVTPAPELTVPLDEVAQIRLNLRWRSRNDPRDIADTLLPPLPSYAGDSPLETAVNKLRELISDE